MLYCTRDAHEGDTTFEEGGYGDLVGCVEGDGGLSAGFGGLVGEAEAGEAGEVGLGEVQLAQGGEVEGEGFLLGYGYALGVGEGVEDGEAHVRDGDLGEDAAVDEFDEGVDGGLGVDGGADLRRGQGEEAAGFDDLEALVHHGGGVDGDALAHDPGGVLEGLLGCDVLEVGQGGVAEGASGGGEPDLPDFAGVPPRMHWWTALCSESMGRRATLCSWAAAMMSSPAATRHSLLARPMVLPALTAA